MTTGAAPVHIRGPDLCPYVGLCCLVRANGDRDTEPIPEMEKVALCPERRPSIREQV